MIFHIDIDGVICETKNGEYELALPNLNRIKKINKLYKDGHTILINTARGAVSGIDWSTLTKRQLKNWGVKYHKIYFNKPYADVYVDDHNIPLKKFDLLV